MNGLRDGARLRILHLFANFKWTGPADPAIRCAARLRQAGADVLFAQAAWTLPGAEHRMRMELARARMPVTGGLELRKHFHVPSLLRDARVLRARLQRGDFDVLHCHLLADHLLAALAKRRAGRTVVLVRSLYDPVPPPRCWRHRVAFRATDGVVAPTARCGEQTAARFALSARRVLWQEPPVEPRAPLADRGAARARLGLGPDDVAIGITARIQPHRRFDLLWDVAQRVTEREPRARFVLLGRGNEHDTRVLVHEPVRERGLAAHVVLPGYLYEPHYGEALQSLDLFSFLVPGSDGTCRAVREAMAVGLPVVATARGVLPDLLGPADGSATPCGLVCEESAQALAEALLALIASPERRRALGDAARAKTREAMDPARAAARLLAFYAELHEAARQAEAR